MLWAERIGRRIKLRDLRIVIAVAKAGGMGKAAAELAMSQPVISKSISDLESALGTRLFDRGTTGVEPTPYGRALIRCGVAVFDDLRRGVRELEFLADPAAGELRVGCTEPLAAGFVSAVIDRISRRYSRAEFHVVPGDAVSLLKRELLERNVELAFVPMPGLSPDADTSVEILFDDRHIVMAGRDSKWARRRKVTLDELMEEPWVLPPPESTSGAYVAAWFRAGGVEPPTTRVVSFSIPLHLHTLASGRFVTSLPRSMVHFAPHLPLRPLRVHSPVLPRPVGMLTLKNRTLSSLALAFIECARNVAATLEDCV